MQYYDDRDLRVVNQQQDYCSFHPYQYQVQQHQQQLHNCYSYQRCCAILDELQQQQVADQEFISLPGGLWNVFRPRPPRGPPPQLHHSIPMRVAIGS